MLEVLSRLPCEAGRDLCALLLVSALAAADATAQAQEPPAPWRLLRPGTFHRDEAPAVPGQGWLALVHRKGQWWLLPTWVRARRVHDEVMDAPGMGTGIALTSGHASALALLRLPSLRAGKVEAAQLPRLIGPNAGYALGEGRVLDIPFRGATYQLAVQGERTFLVHAGRRTALPEVEVSEDQSADFSYSARLLWAGDLDGDGALDLLFGHSTYNRDGVCLYLSSLAPPDALVGLLACQVATGC